MTARAPIVLAPETYYPASDEIDLIDVWLTLVRYRGLFLGVFAAIFTIGVSAAMILPPRYDYSVTIQIGGMRDQAGFNLVETPQALKAELENSYIPEVLYRWADSHSAEPAGAKIEASVPDKGDVVVLKARGTEADSAMYKSLLAGIVSRVRTSHSAMLQGRVDRMRKLLQGQIDQVTTQLSAERQSRAEAVAQGSALTKALTLLLLDSQIQQDQQHLADLEQQLNVGLVSDVRYTDALAPPIRSANAAGLGKLAIGALSGVVGLFLGLLAVFMANFLRLARERAQAAA